MLKPFFFLLPFTLAFQIHAQDSIVISVKPKQSIELSGDAFVNSNAITNDFILAFYNGEFMDDLLKKNVSENLLAVNRLGGVSKAGFVYSAERNIKSGPSGFSFSFFDRQHFDMKFSDDLFQAIFYGNKRFEGEPVSLGNFRMDYLRYQQFCLGWDWKGDYFHGGYGFAFSVLSGDRNFFVDAPVAEMFTSMGGTYIDFDLAIDVRQTDTVHKKYFAQNGMGLSADFYYELPYMAWRNPGKITFEAKDLGFIQWNGNSMHYSADSAYHYEGVDAADIFNVDSTAFQFSMDNVIDKYTLFERKSYSTNIPFTFAVHTKTFYGRRFAFEKGMAFWFNTSAKAYYYAKFHLITGKSKSADIACVAGYGGYGLVHAGMEAKIDFAKNYSVHIAHPYLLTAGISPGMGLQLKLMRRF